MTVRNPSRRIPSVEGTSPIRANGVPTEDVISKRCDANPDTIERWYDMSTESDRREARREYVEDL